MEIRRSLIRAMAFGCFMAVSATQLIYADPAAIVDGERDLLSDVQAQWAKINYELDEDQRAAAFSDLSDDSDDDSDDDPFGDAPAQRQPVGGAQNSQQDMDMGETLSFGDTSDGDDSGSDDPFGSNKSGGDDPFDSSKSGSDDPFADPFEDPNSP